MQDGRRKYNSLAPVLILLILAGWALPSPEATDTDPAKVIEEVRHYRSEHEIEILEELSELLAIPNVASNLADIRRNAEHLLMMLERRGARTQLLEIENVPPAVFGTIEVPGAERTIVVYMHYDGQPVNPENWSSAPWSPVLRDQQSVAHNLAEIRTPVDPEWRIYARCASDDKSPIVAMLTALDALKSAGIPLSVNIKFFLEGEEEAGSSNLGAILEKYRHLLAADVWLFCDGPVHQTRKPQIVFGVRGVTGVRMTVYGPTRPLHSGHYGNWAPNPINLLVHLLAGMRDLDGRILIDGFYDDVLAITETERAALDASPDIDEMLLDELGLARSEGEGRLEERIMLPALNLRAIQSGGAAARNAIQTSATAVVGFRLVPAQTIEGVREKTEAHIRKQGFHIVYDEPDSVLRKAHYPIIHLEWGQGYEPFRTSMDLPVAQAVIRVAEEALGEPIIKMPTAGGSLPLFIFDEVLKTPVIIVPMVNHDNNQHAENENLRIQNLWDGIELYASLLARLGEVWE